ncbi:septin-2 [Lepeophtheirus salmonis]|uniref:Septin n=2 Tax=Lepeophtheirus salmonis TaxID=72036 RepID=C1BSL3_LEPSM|nr:septin-2-like [Lepeophtheirus salmonis]ACO12016.1 Septin-2 [Lepeophtheirus salmonis]
MAVGKAAPSSQSGTKVSVGNGVRTCPLSGHVGFDSLPYQLVHQNVNAGFTFNILCIGETGLGKSTLMDSLFNTSFKAGPSTHRVPSVKLRSNTYYLEEKNVKLKLTLCDTEGYGDQINKEDSFKTIVEYIDAQFESYLQEELKIKRNMRDYHDTRIHVCLYFITPNGHGLKSIDLVCMKKLDSKVNIIPIIAKADTINKAELSKFKLKIISELENNGVQIYKFPVNNDEDSEVNKEMNENVPFAVVGSTDFVKVGNENVRARQYPWGVVQVENKNHCDFVKLKEMLIRTNMEDLRDTTHSKLYEIYRKDRLQQMGFSDSNGDGSSFTEQYNARLENHKNNLQVKEEEMRQKFVLRVKEKEGELKEAEKELHIKYEGMKISVADEKRKVEEQRRDLEDEITDFHRRKAQFEAEKMNSGHHTLTLGKIGKKK